MIVVDASAVCEMLLLEPGGEQIRRRLLTSDETLHAPEMIDLEVVQTLRRRRATGQLVAARAEEAIADFLDLDLVHYTHRELLPRVWQLRDSLSAYDASYVALAELLNAPLLTTDRRLARATGHDARVEYVG